MPRIGAPELIIILVIVLVIFGAGRLPEIGGAIGKGIRAFRRNAAGEDEDKGDGKDTPAAKETEDSKTNSMSH
ncbi:MAG: twin-arginine translocase TatA/TatE family subunit [Dehalococcoidia bacterium]|nr:twin-arginine translocase TatA/TatE family subunit [Dehalococcoidia bacterium]